MDDFGARMRSLREARGLTRTDLARKSGVTKDTIRSIETGRTRTNIVTAEALAEGLAEGLAVPLSALFGDPMPMRITGKTDEILRKLGELRRDLEELEFLLQTKEGENHD